MDQDQLKAELTGDGRAQVEHVDGHVFTFQAMLVNGRRIAKLVGAEWNRRAMPLNQEAVKEAAFMTARKLLRDDGHIDD